mgnify:CR=1 FL=1|jgi:hypothetical protein
MGMYPHIIRVVLGAASDAAVISVWFLLPLPKFGNDKQPTAEATVVMKNL